MSNDIELNLNSYSIINSAYCENVPLAIDDNPETYATFYQPLVPGYVTTQFTPSNTTLNGSAGIVDGNEFQLTPSIGSQAGSLFYNTQIQIDDSNNFSVSWGMTLDGQADGICFVVQNSSSGVNALGTSGGSLGYAGINNSICIKFDIYLDSPDPSNNCTGLFTNGELPLGGIAIDPTIITFNSGRLIQGNIVYTNGSLVLKLTDTVTSNVYTQTFSVDIPSTIGSNKAYVGFTAGTGASNALQTIIFAEVTAIGGVPATDVERYLHFNFQTDLWITRVGYLGNGINAAFAFDSGWNVNNPQNNGIMTVAPIPITAYIPLQVDEGVYDLIIDPPLLANGLWYLPDYLGPDGYPQVQLNQLQVYIYSEDQIIMANPGKNFTIEGCKSLQILPWVASSNYPFNSVNSNYPLAIQSLDISKASKVAEELGGETRYLINSYEYEQRLTGKFSVSRVNMQLFQYLLSGKLIVDNAGTANEAEYFAPQYNDVNPYFTLVGTSDVADGNQIVILPKCKVTGNLAEMWDRTKLTVFDVAFEAHWDGTYICTTGVIGAIAERFWNANASNTPVYS